MINEYLLGQGAADNDVGVLNDGGGIAKDKVNSAVNLAITVELAEWVGIECVLEPDHCASVKHRQVWAHPKRHRLVLLRSRRVLKRHVSSPKSIPGYAYNWYIISN